MNYVSPDASTIEVATKYGTHPEDDTGLGLADILLPLAQEALEAEQAPESARTIESTREFMNDAQGEAPRAQSARPQAATEAVEESEALLEQLEDFDFGLDSPGLSGTGYVSNSELLAWIKTHSLDLNNQIRDLMNGAEARTKIVEDLTKIKGMVDVSSPETTKAAAEAMFEAYEGTPYEAEVEEILNPLISSLDNRIDNHDGEMPDDLITTLQGNLQQKIDAYAKQDQIDMIQIQDLTSRIREGIQLVSNIISSCNQTSMAIVGNVGR